MCIIQAVSKEKLTYYIEDCKYKMTQIGMKQRAGHSKFGRNRLYAIDLGHHHISFM